MIMLAIFLAIFVWAALSRSSAQKAHDAWRAEWLRQHPQTPAGRVYSRRWGRREWTLAAVVLVAPALVGNVLILIAKAAS